VLKRIKINNIGLIDSLSADFGPGLNIITGETGAGKSMILSSLNLILGERADYSHLKNSEKDGSAEGVFEIEGFTDFLEQGIETDDGEYIIRRVLKKEGKSRVFTNGSAVTLASLKKAGEKMVDIHGQHEHQLLLKKETHLSWLDLFLNLQEERAEFYSLLSETGKLQKQLAELRAKQKEMLAGKEFLEFKADELESACIREDEEADLEREHAVLANADSIRQSGAALFDKLYDSESSLLVRIDSALKEFERLKSSDPFFEKYSTVFADISAGVADCAMEIQAYCSGLESDPARLAKLEERQALIAKLKRKYGAGDANELLNILKEALAELEELESAEESTEALEEELAALKLELTEKAQKLHAKRMEGIPVFRKAVTRELRELNFEKAEYEVEVNLPEASQESGCLLEGQYRKIFSHGFGEFQFLISTNPGHPPRPLAKIASGGEISRIMLGIKCATGKIQPVPVLVFDEIDAGIGGKTADMVGEKLKKLSKNCQIFCITHLPQIARQADRHFVVEKNMRNGKTCVSIRRLEGEDRVEELARMQAGKKVTDAARKHAREMIAS